MEILFYLNLMYNFCTSISKDFLKSEYYQDDSCSGYDKFCKYVNDNKFEILKKYEKATGIEEKYFKDNKKILEKTISNLQEVITRGANVILITSLNIKSDKMEIIKVPEVKDIVAPILAIVPLQLIAYYIAKEKKLDVDKPRNLAKSVTVE